MFGADVTMRAWRSEAPAERWFDVAVLAATTTGLATASGRLDTSRSTWLHHTMYAACVVTWCGFAGQRRRVPAVAPSGVLLVVLPFTHGRGLPHRFVGTLLAAEGVMRRRRGARWS